MDKKLLEDIRSINESSDQKKVRDLRERIQWLNVNDPNNREIFLEAREKGI